MKRSGDFRYTVVMDGADLTPLAEVEAYYGPLTLQILNISAGGVAFLFSEEPTLQIGDVAAVSISIRGRAFPVQIQIRALRGHRVHSAFLNPPPAFSAALRDFLKPKFLGGNLKYNIALSSREDVLTLVEGAKVHEAFVGQNQAAAFVWLNERRHVLRLLSVVRDLVFEWTPEFGIRTGRLQEKDNEVVHPEGVEEGIKWDAHDDVTVIHYFTDVFIPWLHGNSELVERLTQGQSESGQGDGPIVFPKLY